MVFRRTLMVTTGTGLAVFMAGASPLQRSAQLPSFHSVSVPKGGHVVLRSGPAPRASVVRGSRDYVRMAVTSGGVLVIDTCPSGCPRQHGLEIEVVAPSFARVSLSNGGRVSSSGSFPRQAELTASVSNGGTVDVRSMQADRVNASVEQGGRILTIPRGALLARVSNGGVVTWWGDAKVTRSIEHGGVVQKGEASEMNLPLSDVGGPRLPSLRNH